MTATTTLTWDDLGRAGLVHERQADQVLFWQQECDLAQELHERMDNIDGHTAGTLVAATRAGIPVTLTWRTATGWGPATVTTAVIIDNIVVENLFAGSVGYAFVRYAGGFAHRVYLNHIISATTVEPVYS